MTTHIFNSIGYWADNAYYYFIKDHLGNICAVVNATADTVVQRTMYYASGVPMAQSWGRDTQPYLYNGKEFIEAHGWNTYDYGFRGYYAPIARFTSIDPLAEQTPWQSPYAYANNNFINAIDWMGLSGMTNLTNENVVQCIIVNSYGYVIGGADDGDDNIYIDLDGEWDATEGKSGLIWVSEMEHSYMWYMSRAIASLGGGGGLRAVSPSQIATAIGRSLMKDISVGIADNFLRNEFGKELGPIGNNTTKIIANGRTIENLYQVYEYYKSQGLSPRVAYDAAKEFLTIGVTAILDGTVEKTIKKAIDLAPALTRISVTVAPYVLASAGVILTGWCYYETGKYFINTVNSLNAYLNSKEFWAYIYGFDYNGNNW